MRKPLNILALFYNGCMGTYFIIVTETAYIYSIISLLVYFIVKMYSKVCYGGAERE